MKKVLLSFFVFMIMLQIGKSQQTATDFTLTDCAGISRNLFSMLDSGKVVVLIYEHQCGSCTSGSKKIASVINTFYSTDTSVVVMYLDNGGYNCSSTNSWISSNTLAAGITFAYSSDYSSPYGSGMPVVAIVGGATHHVYLKAIGTNAIDTNQVHNAIKQALSDNATGIEELSSLHSDLTIYPNPVSVRNETCQLIIDASVSVTSADIVDFSGVIVRQVDQSVFLTNSANRKIPVHHLSEGLYVIRLYTDRGVMVQKFIVTK